MAVTNNPPGAEPDTPPHTDTTVPHSARIWNYWLGGTDNYPVDRAAGTLDFGQPIALMLMWVMGHVDDPDAHRVVAELVGGLPAGSYLALQDGVMAAEAFNEAQEGYDDTGAIPYRLRTPEQIAAFFGDLDVVDPGLVALPRWRPDPGQAGPDVDSVGGVARKAARA